jgi:hypothetical protein
VLVNVVTLDKADEQAFLKTWQDDAAFMKRQPGFNFCLIRKTDDSALVL